MSDDRARRGRRTGSAANRVVTLLIGALLLLTAQSTPAASGTGSEPGQGRHTADRGGRTWVGTWSTTPTAVPASDGTVFEDQTVRQTVHTSVGGNRVRVRFSNEFGDRPLVIGEARIARRSGDGSTTRIDPRTDRALTFGGRAATTVPAGAPALSDPVDLAVPAGSDLVISVHLPERTPGSTVHAFAFQHNHAAPGNVTGAADIEPTATFDRWYFLTGVSVSTHRGASAVVAFGDSITDGSDTDVNANHRWPDILARRLRSAHGPHARGVLNQGVSGNRLLHDPNPPAGSDAENYAAYFGQSALRRFDRDVAAQPGAEHVIVLLGVNDLGHPGTTAPASEKVTAQDLIDAHRQIIARAHERGLKAHGGTILPFKGDTLGFHSEENEAARQAVNRWIRTSGEYDGVVDFDRALRDPSDPLRLNSRYDSGDHLHPNDAGAKAMAGAVPLHLLR
ncbi:SGNH/GDSL hydrolase family protein [Streptomyces sp. TRM43335]|uniref:SGNH/GDSL hydrolase family protein n=1 Tax=Streptomyces taklimakanensis TaxID=2569853 RepID=A0A6G2B9K0_9ACTN|nr:SGNH/GDSL hydrolase family protein [Streptomyces taklimakanensis]MTE18743.1 SGNH/GDSL hydrolase family protein [Streptomyces taklimakanensis]